MHHAHTQRPRLLLVAFYCNPEFGSEAAEGWNRALECARHFDTWVITHGSENTNQVKQYLAAHSEIPNLHLEFVEFPKLDERLLNTRWCQWIVFKRWHRRALELAKRLHAELKFDLVHQVTGIAYREPGYLWQLDAPFVWGPVGGTETFPWRFLTEAGLASAANEAARNLINAVQMRCSPRVRRAARRATPLIAANSSGQQSFARAHGISSLLMSDAGVSRVVESPRPERSPDDPLRILWSGQFVPRKALSLLIKALATLPDDVKVELRVLGGGRMERRWQQLATRLNVDARIEWLGWRPYQEALGQYQWADAFAFTSLRDTMGNVALEALSNGLPIVCLDHQGVHDVVTPACGIKVAVQSRRQVVADLGAALTRLARDPALCATMSRAALTRAAEYRWDALGARLIDVYRGLLPGRQPNLAEIRHLPAAVASPAKTAHYTSARPLVRLRGTLRRCSERAVTSAARGMHGMLGDDGQGFGILMYHRVADNVAGFARPTWNVTPLAFRQQLEGLLARGYRAWPLRQLVEMSAEGVSPPPKSFVVTFDDGYESLYRNAWPVLQSLNIPATIFLPTAYLDSPQPFPCDDWEGAGSSSVPSHSWRIMSTEQCREMMAGGLIDFGAHTHTHERFLGRREAFAHDLELCLDVLRERFGIENPAFAFPFGANSPELIETARMAGVSSCMSTLPTRVRPGDDPFSWGRFDVEDRDSAAVVAAKLAGWYTVADGARRALAHPIKSIRGTAARQVASAAREQLHGQGALSRS